MSLLVQAEGLHQQIVSSGGLEGMVFLAGDREQEGFRGPTLQALRRIFQQSEGERTEGHAHADAINDKLGQQYEQVREVVMDAGGVAGDWC